MIQTQAKYWYSRLAFMYSASLDAATGPNIFSLNTWNNDTDYTIQARLRDIASNQDVNLQFDVSADAVQTRMFGDQMPPGLRPVNVNAGAVSNLSLQVTNNGTSATANTQVRYGVDVWQLPVPDRIMRNIPMPDAEKKLAQQVGLGLDPSTMQGTFPRTIGDIIEHTYENRQIASPLYYYGKSPAALVSDTPIGPVTVLNSNDLLVLRRVWAQAPDGSDYGVRVRVDQDANPSVLDLDAGMMTMDEPVDVFLPARRTLTFHIIATTAQPPGPIPLRFEVWHCAQSTISRVRLGLQQLSAITTIMVNEGLAALPTNATAAQKAQATAVARQASAALYARILAGVK